MEATYFSETSIDFQRTTRHYIQKIVSFITAPVRTSKFISLSLPSNGSTCHNIFLITMSRSSKQSLPSKYSKQNECMYEFLICPTRAKCPTHRSLLWERIDVAIRVFRRSPIRISVGKPANLTYAFLFSSFPPGKHLDATSIRS
jgi:hypothetical protein